MIWEYRVAIISCEFICMGASLENNSRIFFSTRAVMVLEGGCILAFTLTGYAHPE